MSGSAIGIDIGTTFSRCAVCRNEKVVVIPNDRGNLATPSYVAFNPKECLVGDAAQGQAAFNAENTVYSMKRLIGRRLSQTEVQMDVSQFSFNVVDVGLSRPGIQVDYKGKTITFSPEEISAMILSKLKDDAEEYLSCKVTSAVVSVPSCLGYAQIEAIKKTGQISGLRISRVLGEATAAAITYGIDHQLSEERHVMVFDLGGGSLGISLLRLEDGIFEVIATGGDSHLGGEDFDNRMVQFFVTEFERKHRMDISSNLRALRRLRTSCERAKRTLSSTSRATIEIDSLYKGIDFYSSITRVKFEELCIDLFQAAIESVETVFREGKIPKDDVEEVVLVGGSSRIPRVQSMLSSFFNGKRLFKSINPDEAVVCGAAVQAALLGPANTMPEKLKEILMLNSIPISLGIETGDGEMSLLAKSHCAVPTKKSLHVSTSMDNQRRALIKLFEGSRKMTQENRFLGFIELSGLQPAPKGIPQIRITLDIDENFTLAISAEDTSSTGRKQKLALTGFAYPPTAIPSEDFSARVVAVVGSSS